MIPAPALFRDYSQFRKHGAPVCLAALRSFTVINNMRLTNGYSNVIQLSARRVATNINYCRTLKLILACVYLPRLYQLMLRICELAAEVRLVGGWRQSLKLEALTKSWICSKCGASPHGILHKSYTREELIP